MLNAEDKPERKHSSSDGELECGFGDRLRDAIGARSVLSFAKECGISDSLVRKYLSGSLPGLDKAVVMARVAGVSLEWLATGKSHPEGEPPATAEPGQSQLDLDTLEVVIAKTLEAFEERRPELSAEARARIIRLIYEFYTKQGKPMDQASLDNVIELAAFR